MKEKIEALTDELLNLGVYLKLSKESRQLLDTLLKINS